MSAARHIARRVVMARARKKAEESVGAPKDKKSPGKYRRFMFRDQWSKSVYEW